jgi:hypothetical protein
MNKKNKYQLTNPFSEEFLKIWEIWKEYKWASHNFKYKSIFSEQAALEQVWTLSGGEEEKAEKIIKQSMRREWQGLFPLHETTTGNGKQKQSTSKKSGEPTTSLRQQAADEFSRRHASGGQQTDGTHLKAV